MRSKKLRPAELPSQSQALGGVGADITAPVVQLLSDLTKAFNSVSPQISSDEKSSYERARYVCVILSLSRFIESIGGCSEHADKLCELASALDDLDRGADPPLLSRRKVSNRAPDSSEVWRGRALVALGLDALIKLGTAPKAACRRIASEYPGIERLTTKKARGIGSSALDWRVRFKRNGVKNHQATIVFHAGRECLLMLDSDNSAQLNQIAAGWLSDAERMAHGLSPAS
jgi:hypothetical protein